MAEKGGDGLGAGFGFADEAGVVDFQRRNAAADESRAGMAGLLAVGLSDVGVLTGLLRFAIQFVEHALLAEEDFVHVAFHVEDAVVKRFEI